MTIKIMIVDDSILIRRSLVKLLDEIDAPIQLTEAVNVPEGIRTLREFCPDIIIIDIRMPGGSGFDVLKALEKQEQRPVSIVLSKYSTKKFKEEAAKFGADHFFDKSTEFGKVVKVIEDYCIK